MNKKQIALCNIHLDARLNAKQRIEQLDFVLKKLQKETNVIIGGYFNTIPMFLAAHLGPILYDNQNKKIHEHMLSRGFTEFCQLKKYTMRRGPLKMKLDTFTRTIYPLLIAA